MAIAKDYNSEVVSFSKMKKLSLSEDLKRQRELRARGAAQMLKIRNIHGVPSTMGDFLQAGMSIDETVDFTLSLLKYNLSITKEDIDENWIREKAQGMCDLILWGNQGYKMKRDENGKIIPIPHDPTRVPKLY